MGWNLLKFAGGVGAGCVRTPTFPSTGVDGIVNALTSPTQPLVWDPSMHQYHLHNADPLALLYVPHITVRRFDEKCEQYERK